MKTYRITEKDIEGMNPVAVDNIIGNFQIPQQNDAMPDELIINGIKYRRVEE